MKAMTIRTSTKYFGYFTFIILLGIVALIYNNRHYAMGELRKLKTPKPETLQLYEQRLSEIQKLSKNGPYDYEIIFVGDSLANSIFAFSSHNYPNLQILNLGIPNDTTELLANRVEVIQQFNAELVVLLIGTNDVGRNILLQETLNNITKIFSAVESFNVAVVAIPYSDGWQRDNEIINELNRKMLKLTENKALRYIDSNSILSEKNRIKPNYTTDGLHLSEEGNHQLLKHILSIANLIE